MRRLLAVRHRARRALRFLTSPLTALVALLAIATLVLRSWALETLPARMALAAVLVVSAGAVALIAHELGHLLASRAVGFRTLAVTLGPFVFVRRGGRVRVRLADWRAGAGGSVTCLPRDERGLRRRWIMIVAAGPLANLLLTLGCASVVRELPAVVLERALAQTPAHAPLVLTAAFLPTLALTSLAFAFASLWPARRRGVWSDGAQLRVLVRGGATAERWCSQLLVSAAARDGVRPRAWPDRWIRDLLAVHDESDAEVIAMLTAYHQALDTGAHERAATLIDDALARSGSRSRGLRAAARAEAAYFAARFSGDPERARALLAELSPDTVPRILWHRALAAMLLLEERWTDAAAAASAGLNALVELERRDGVRLPAEEDWLRELLTAAECACVVPECWVA